ncbi:MAG: GNAT family N-acetyltransferase [Rhodobacteraceae bacterium]|nr:GNAT family N-acetyltransferase [Paracoccaceae bacterium]
MTGEFHIRRFRPEDAEATRDIFYDAVRIGAAEHYRAEDLADWAGDRKMPEGWGEWLDRHFTVVGEADGRPAGFFMLEASGYLNMAFVRPEYRRTGLADQLYAAILAEARHREIPCLTVWASRMMRRFLARHGWSPDPAPPPLAGHPVPTDDDKPLDFPMKLVLLP